MDIWLSANVKAHSFISEEYWKNHFEEVKSAIAEAEVYVYEDAVIKGFVGLIETYIAGIFVKEDFQSQGIGTELIQYLQNFKSELVLNVYEKNKKAVDFYIRHNFQISQKKNEEETNHMEYQMIWKRQILSYGGFKVKIIEYFGCNQSEQKHWLHKIEQSDWEAGQLLYTLLHENKFSDFAGENPKVWMLTDGNELISFCTYSKVDDIKPTELTPWIGFVYTFPQYRGHHYMEILFREIERFAKTENVQNIFISTGEIGLYEKYGCEFYQFMNDVHGVQARVYIKHIGDEV